MLIDMPSIRPVPRTLLDCRESTTLDASSAHLAAITAFSPAGQPSTVPRPGRRELAPAPAQADAARPA